MVITGTTIPTILTTNPRIAMMNITNLHEHISLIFFFQLVTPTEIKEYDCFPSTKSVQSGGMGMYSYVIAQILKSICNLLSQSGSSQSLSSQLYSSRLHVTSDILHKTFECVHLKYIVKGWSKQLLVYYQVLSTLLSSTKFLA